MNRDLHLQRRPELAWRRVRLTLDTVTTWIPLIRKDRHRDVMNLWLRGDSAEQIGQALGVTRERARQMINTNLKQIGRASRNELIPDALNRLFILPGAAHEADPR